MKSGQARSSFILIQVISFVYDELVSFAEMSSRLTDPRANPMAGILIKIDGRWICNLALSLFYVDIKLAYIWKYAPCTLKEKDALGVDVYCHC